MTALAVQVEAPALVPPWRERLPLEVFAVLIETMMFSMEAAVRAQSRKASRKRVQVVVLNMLAGKLARFVQLRQVSRKPSKIVLDSLARPVTLDITIAGKLVRLLQLIHACEALVTEFRLIKGNEVRDVQLFQA